MSPGTHLVIFQISELCQWEVNENWVTLFDCHMQTKQNCKLKERMEKRGKFTIVVKILNEKIIKIKRTQCTLLFEW